MTSYTGVYWLCIHNTGMSVNTKLLQYFIFLTVLLFHANAFSENDVCNAQSDEIDIKSEIELESQKEPTAYERWYKEYHVYLLDQEEAHAKLDGIAFLIDEKNNAQLTQKIKGTFTSLFSQYQQHFSIADRIEELCENQKLELQCENKPDFFKFYPINDSAISHLKPINIAYKNNDYQRVEELIQSMTNAENADIYFEDHALLIHKHIANYLNINPPEFSFGWLDLSEIMTAATIYTKYLSQEMTLDEYDETILQNQVVIISQFLIFPYLSVGALFEYCNKSELDSLCEQIGHTMTKGNTLYVQHLGYQLLMKVHLNRNEDVLAHDFQLANKLLHEYNKCLNGFPEALEGGYLYPAHFSARIESYSNGKNELQSIRDSSYAIYHDLSDIGVNLTFDPYLCEDILNMSQDEYMDAFAQNESSE